MRVVKSAPNGVIDSRTLFEFFVQEGVVTASYHGGRVVQGSLVGRIGSDGRLHFCYAQMHDDGRLACGESVCDIAWLGDGRLQITEHFNWDAGTGVNVMEQVRQ